MCATNVLQKVSKASVVASEWPEIFPLKWPIELAYNSSYHRDFQASKGLYLITSKKAVGFGLVGKMGLPAESKTSKQ